MPIFTADVPHKALEAWAAARGLTYAREGLLPPLAGPLRLSVGVGSRIAGLVTSQSDHHYTAKGGFERREERGTHNLCEGRLPGDIPGILAHHHHLEERSSNDGSTWVADVDTVVVHRLAERSRAVRELTYDGSTWTARPPEDEQTLHDIGSRETMTALARAGERARVEVRDGVVCVWTRGIVEDADRLDALCLVAAGVAAGVKATVARHGELDATQPLPPPPQTQERLWLERGADLVTWNRPPASVAAAKQAYVSVVEAEGIETGENVRGISLSAMLVGALIWAAISFGFGVLFYGPVLGGILALGGLIIAIFKSYRAAHEAGEETTTEVIEGSAGPWALEAFTREYAKQRGYTIEDPDEVRHRFPSPLAGHPQRAMFTGAGHLLLWRDTTANTYWLLAVTKADGPAPSVPAPYRADVLGGLLVTGVQVTAEDRSAAALDALVAVTQRGA